MKIKSIRAYEVLASGGYPSIEAEVTLENGITGVASVPYGASAGSHEATVLEDKDPARYDGHGMLKAASNVNTEISQAIVGMEVEDQLSIDKKMIELDGTPNKARLGGNAILAASVAAARAAANLKSVPLYRHIIDTFNTGVDLNHLPNPMVVVIEGGKHADNSTDLQEFCMSGVGEISVTENIRKVIESYHKLKPILSGHNLSTNVGNEGAFAPSGIETNESPFLYILEAISHAGYTPGKDIKISVDSASSEFYENGKYNLKLENRSLTADELSSYFQSWFQKYPFVTFEDPFAEDDWENWVKFLPIAKQMGVEIVGDDLTVTNIERLQKAIDLKAISSILIKLNQIGSLSETVACCMLAKQNGLMTVTSHRGGGETNDAAMVDLAVAVGSKFVKVGPTRGERVAKYNRLMQIESELRG